ncbi:MAG: leucine-rich repeat domain-containing protein [Clostridia bacterium]|nr:leucine-rich repeat domain-containing protein [Clostridia bacterium]
MKISSEEKQVRFLFSIALLIVLGAFFLFFFRFTDTLDAKFEYTVDAEGYATVKGYTADPKTLEIPSEIDGHPVKYIDTHAFGGHESSLRKVIIPEGVVAIGEFAFANAPDLQTVELPSTLRSIGRGAFSGCAYLKTITLPEGLQSLDAEVFDGCVRLGKLKIPASVSEIGVDCFASCENLLLDVSENALAADIAAQYNIETGSVDSFTVYLFIALLSSVLAVVGVFVLIRFVGKRKKPKA